MQLTALPPSVVVNPPAFRALQAQSRYAVEVWRMLSNSILHCRTSDKTSIDKYGEANPAEM